MNTSAKFIPISVFIHDIKTLNICVTYYREHPVTHYHGTIFGIVNIPEN